MSAKDPLSAADIPSLKLRDLRSKQFEGLTAVDLFSGMGGFTIAADWLGVKILAACDNWGKAQEAYERNFSSVPFVSGDLMKDETVKRVAELVDANDGCDLLLAGPPCQGFSQIRNGFKDHDDKRNRLTLRTIRLVRELKPRAFMIENVPLMLAHKEGNFRRYLLKGLRSPGDGLSYAVQWRVIDAAVMGVPQQRRRAILLGVRKGEGEVSLPALPELGWFFTAKRRGLDPPDGAEAVDRILQSRHNDRLVTVGQAIGDLPRLAAGAREVDRTYRGPSSSEYQVWMRGRKRTVSATATPTMKEKTTKRLRALGPGQCVKDLPARLSRGLDRKYGSAYRRLHPDVPATTLFTKWDCAYHHSATRALSVREYSRLQSIPDAYEFPVAARHAYAMIGNAIPPAMAARVLALAIDLN